MKKVFLGFFCGFLILTILTGCRSNKINKSNNYLKEKYNENFSFKNYGDTILFSVSEPLIFSDSSGNDFIVSYEKDFITDNYEAIVYDNNIQSDLQNHYGNQLKVFISTQNSFFGESDLFENYYDYIQKCSNISIAFYTKDNIDLILIKDYLSKYNLDMTGKVTAIIYQVYNNTYNDVNKYNYNVNSSSIIDSQSFSF